MPVLKSEKHERFCQLVANGEKPYKAYELAGYSAKSRQTGYRLLKKPYIAERIGELTMGAVVKPEVVGHARKVGVLCVD